MERSTRIALAVWQGRISPVFDVSRQVLVVDIEQGRPAGRKEESFASADPFGRAAELARWKVETLICGAISHPFSACLAAQGIRLVSFVAGEVEEVIEAYLAGALPSPALAMPGCCGRRRRFRGGRCGPGGAWWQSEWKGG